jgi:2-phospho-L-lactate guanylyltransferase
VSKPHSLFAILPIKGFTHAKQRLAPAFSPDFRAKLAEAMFTDVLEQLTQTYSPLTIIVVTSDESAANIATNAGAMVAADNAYDINLAGLEMDSNGHSRAADVGAHLAETFGATEILLLPGDCPALTNHDIDDLINTHRENLDPYSRQLTIVSNRSHDGTNAMLLSPPDLLSFSFGPGSFSRHASQAQAKQAKIVHLSLKSLELDIDCPADLSELSVLFSQLESRIATQTRKVLASTDKTLINTNEKLMNWESSAITVQSTS